MSPGNTGLCARLVRERPVSERVGQRLSKVENWLRS